MNFLRYVAEYYAGKQSGCNDWRDKLFIFPSHRACVFFREELKNVLRDRSVLLGNNIMTLDEFIYLQDGEKKRAERLEQTFELYFAYDEVLQSALSPNDERREDFLSFEFFYSWASVLISDFEDIDKYMLNVDEVYRNIEDYERLYPDLSQLDEEQREIVERVWNIKMDEKEGEEGAYYHKRFIEIYGLMPAIYKKWHERLEGGDKKRTTAGRIYREVATRGIADDGKTSYVLIGFNALTESEIVIFESLKRTGRADFLWDYNEYILRGEEKDEHGAGRFLRKFVKRFAEPSDFKFEREVKEQTIRRTKCAYPQSEVAVVKEFLAETESDGEAYRRAIVLADESMLLPVLSTLPESVSEVNVTMGYPISLSQVCGLVDLICRMQKMNTTESGDYYYKYVLAILQHPCVRMVVGKEGIDVDGVVEKIISGNMIFMRGNDMDWAKGSAFLSELFRPVEAHGVGDYFAALMKAIMDATDEGDALTVECVRHAIRVCNAFGGIVGSYIAQLKSSGELTRIVLGMFGQVLSRETVDFIGEPLQGLQIMGLLETRVLDFDKVIILDMNEGVFPKSNSSQSFIPYAIRRFYNLPTHEYRDSIFSYYFFRLIARPELVHLCYSECGERGQGESRFVQQLRFRDDINVRQADGRLIRLEKEKVAVNALNVRLEGEPIVEKTPWMMRLLESEYLGEGARSYLSPTSISNYMACPLIFYFQKLLKFSEDKDVAEELDGAMFGNVFHRVMEDLYKNNLKGRAFAAGDRLVLKGQSRNLVLQKMLGELTKEEPTVTDDNFDEMFLQLRGSNVLNFSILETLVGKQIDSEEEGFVFQDAETKVRSSVKVGEGGRYGSQLVKVGGNIDRQHEVDGLWYIVDYKTGVNRDTAFKCDDLIELMFDRQKHDETKAVMQTCMYAMMLMNEGFVNPRTGKKVKEFGLGVMFSKALLGGKVSSYKVTNNKELVVYDELFHKAFVERLQSEVLREIFSEDVPFKRGEEVTDEQCARCVYRGVCVSTRR